MSQGSTGISASEAANIAQNVVRAELQQVYREINDVRRELQNEINRLEREMREVGEMIAAEIRQQTSQLGNQIENQTIAVVGGVAANTVMLERTKSQIEEDFSKTRTKLELQTEASLQIEVGKKMSDSVSLHGKLMAFARDIRSRFDRSLELFFMNRQLYNLNFKNIRDEYQNKIRTIGEHIFSIRDNDITPAVVAASSPLEEIHSLPMEVDLYRLKVRAENLDETLQMLKQSRFDAVLESLDSLEANLSSQFAIDQPLASGRDQRMAVVGLATLSSLSDDFMIGRDATPVTDKSLVNISAAEAGLSVFESRAALEKISSAMQDCDRRAPTEKEVSALLSAADVLLKKQLISEEAAVLFRDFLNSGKLMLAGANHGIH
jgi:hypothetical protein